MPAPPLTIYVIAGCNGAGKTTFAREFLPREVACTNFLNADLIAQGLSPFDSPAAAIQAGRLLLSGFRNFIARRETFAFESTLSGRTYIRLLRAARTQGYRIYLHYLWLPNPGIAIARVRERVKKGGHNVPPADVRRRFHRSLLYTSFATTPCWLTAGLYGTTIPAHPPCSPNPALVLLPHSNVSCSHHENGKPTETRRLHRPRTAGLPARGAATTRRECPLGIAVDSRAEWAFGTG